MNVFIYRAALLCADCAKKTMDALNLQMRPAGHDEDSDRYPQGPYSNGGGEADTPQHCDHCGLFLENPLTVDGANYVRTAVSAADIGDTDRDTAWVEIANKADDIGRPALAEWIRFYLAPGM